jgi:hypothetical protein
MAVCGQRRAPTAINDAAALDPADATLRLPCWSR